MGSSFLLPNLALMASCWPRDWEHFIHSGHFSPLFHPWHCMALSFTKFCHTRISTLFRWILFQKHHHLVSWFIRLVKQVHLSSEEVSQESETSIHVGLHILIETVGGGLVEFLLWCSWTKNIYISLQDVSSILHLIEAYEHRRNSEVNLKSLFGFRKTQISI